MAGGRPKKVIDYEAVEKLAGIMATQEEIAAFLDISVRTLLRDTEFCQIYKKGLDKGKMSLRRKQFNMSETNPTMAIWLGKQYLDQHDKKELEHSGEILTKVQKLSDEDLEKELNKYD